MNEKTKTKEPSAEQVEAQKKAIEKMQQDQSDYISTLRKELLKAGIRLKKSVEQLNDILPDDPRVLMSYINVVAGELHRRIELEIAGSKHNSRHQKNMSRIQNLAP